MLFAFFAAMGETERENIREATLEGLDAAARKGKHGGRPAVITPDMLHTVLRRRAAGETVEQIRPDLFIPIGKRTGRNPSVASVYRTLAAYEKTQAYPDAVEQARTEHAQRTGVDLPVTVRPRPARVLDPIDPELTARIQGRPLDRAK
jgi:DNA invertase Pin-like site-specific DNA recombinase